MVILSRKSTSARITAMKVVFIYALFSAIWITSSDQMLLSLVKSSEILTKIQTVKGWFFVIVTSSIIYVLFYRELKKVRQAETISRDREAKLQAVIEAIPDLIWLKNTHGVFVACNPKFESLFGAKQSDIIGKTDYDFFNKEVADFFRENDMAAISAGGPHINEEEITYKNDGHRELVETIKTPMFDSDGNVIGVLGVGRDITVRRKMEDRLRQAQKMESIGHLAGGIAHDFNNILSSILGFSELALEEAEKDSTMEDNLQEIYAGGLRAKEIVKQILAFARQSDQKLKPIRVDAIVLEALKLIRPSTPTIIEIRKEIESSSLVMGNATQIHQIIMNLCTNAAHAMQDDGGIMEVTLKDVFFEENANIPGGLEKGKYIELTISDNGCGIEPEHIDSIFDPYFTTKDTGEGTGMGLAMVHGIVDSYGGSITVASDPSRKTVFTVYLPITSDLDNEIIDETGTLPRGDEHIFFVDDESSIARMGSRILESLGYQVTTRTSCIEALELFKAKPGDFQLVITDMTMPHMNGDKFAIELRQIRADIPIILCTGYSSKINAEIAQEIGINAFTSKPFSKADLASTIREVLDKT